MSRKNNHIDRLTPELMARYQRGELSPGEMHAVERLMLESDFDAEAMEGMEFAGTEAFLADLDELGHRLDKRTEQQRSFRWWQAAAAVAVLVTAGLIVFNTLPDKPQAERISQRSEPLTDTGSPSAEYEEKPQVTDETERDAAPETPVAVEGQEKKSSEGEYPQQAAAEARENVAAPEASPEIMEAEPISEQTLAEAEISTLPRVTPDTMPEADLPEPVITENRQGIVGIIKGEDLDPMSALSGRRQEQIHGKVIDKSGAPLPYARLRVRETNQSLTTNQEGEFDLNLEDEGDQRVIVSFVGLKSQEMTIAEQDSAVVILDEDTSLLAEISLQKKSAENNVIYRGAGPLGGQAGFAEYLRENTRLPVDAEEASAAVTVIFTVTSKGELTDFNVRRSPGPSFTQEALRVIREGPEWLPALEDGVPVRDRVRIRVRFEN